MTATLTCRGAATRSRIVAAAAALMASRGVAGTSLDDILRATGTSKSQLYHYFRDKSDLVRAVIEHQRDAVLAEQQLDTEPLDSPQALQRWRYRTMAAHRLRGFTQGCQLGRLAAELANADEPTRSALTEAFDQWCRQLAAGLTTMVRHGVLCPEADPVQLAAGLLANLQGGLLLAVPARDPRPLQDSLDRAIGQVLALLTSREPIESPPPDPDPLP